MLEEVYEIMDNVTFKTVEEVLILSNGNPKEVVIPNYQRGYKWSVKDWNGRAEEPSALEKLLNDLNQSYENQNDYFLQGITVQERDSDVILIDGQQRVTSLYLLLWYLGGPDAIGNINLRYDIRKKSGEFLSKLKEIYWNNPNDFLLSEDDEQDVYYFKQAIYQIDKFFSEKEVVNKRNMEDYIKRHVKVIYVTVDTIEKAVRTFTMMNGAKATMLDEELVKAEILRRVSHPQLKNVTATASLEGGLELLRDICAEDWETTVLRSRCAREWDRWLYWWNNPDVQDFFNVTTPMGLLLEYFFRRKNTDRKMRLTFDVFMKEFLSGTDGQALSSGAKHVFKQLRHLQKLFEDVYDNPVVYNLLGLALRSDESGEKFDIVNYFIENKCDEKALERYVKCKMAGATHREITGEEDAESLQNRQKEFVSNLEEPDVYGKHQQECYKFLTYLNTVEDNKLNRKVDFSIWRNKSLEHIFPKSKVYHKDENGELFRGDGSKCTEKEVEEIKNGDRKWLAREDIENQTESKLTEHCIGNLVLLYKNNNSEFGDKSFLEKKNVFFNVNDKDFRSRQLLHTISKFTCPEWRAKEIANYYHEVKTQLDKFYE